MYASLRRMDSSILLLIVYVTQGREARLTNVLAETDVITQDGLKDLSYTLVTQRESENKVTKEPTQCVD